MPFFVHTIIYYFPIVNRMSLKFLSQTQHHEGARELNSSEGRCLPCMQLTMHADQSLHPIPSKPGVVPEKKSQE